MMATVNLHFWGLFGVLRGRRCTGRGGSGHGHAWRKDSSAAAFRREASQRRAEAMRRLYPKLSTWKADRALLDRIGEVDRYLAQATDPLDFDCRIGEIERRALHARTAP